MNDVETTRITETVRLRPDASLYVPIVGYWPDLIADVAMIDVTWTLRMASDEWAFELAKLGGFRLWKDGSRGRPGTWIALPADLTNHYAVVCPTLVDIIMGSEPTWRPWP